MAVITFTRNKRASSARWLKRHPGKTLAQRHYENCGVGVGRNFLRNYAYGRRNVMGPVY